MRSIGRDPLFIDRADGPHVWDADGNRYVDYLATWGPAILGHAHPGVLSDLRDALPRGTSYGAPTEREIDFAEAVVAAFPSIEQLRMTSSGQRGGHRRDPPGARRDRPRPDREDHRRVPRRDRPLARRGRKRRDDARDAEQPGRPRRRRPRDAVGSLQRPRRGRGGPRRGGRDHRGARGGNMGTVAPAAGYLDGLRAACDRTGALLILDEVITGFRIAYGGAQERFGVRADITCLGKVIGGGLPVGAFGGRRDVMRELAPEGPCYQAGTLSGNPLATTAGLATLRHLARPRGLRAARGIRRGARAGDRRERRAGRGEPRRLDAHAVLYGCPRDRLRIGDRVRHRRPTGASPGRCSTTASTRRPPSSRHGSRVSPTATPSSPTRGRRSDERQQRCEGGTRHPARARGQPR